MIRGITWTHILIYNQFGIIQVLQRSPIPPTSNWLGTFFLLLLSKMALAYKFTWYFVLKILLTYSEAANKSIAFFFSFRIFS